jgi:hypothetical protein
MSHQRSILAANTQRISSVYQITVLNTQVIPCRGEMDRIKPLRTARCVKAVRVGHKAT